MNTAAPDPSADAVAQAFNEYLDINTGNKSAGTVMTEIWERAKVIHAQSAVTGISDVLLLRSLCEDVTDMHPTVRTQLQSLASRIDNGAKIGVTRCRRCGEKSEVTIHTATLSAPAAAVGGDLDFDGALEALESMDDYARMDVGVAPHGPYAVLKNFITAARRPTPAAPAGGFVAVPREPTEAMLRAGSCVMPPDSVGQNYLEKEGALRCWRLMLLAAEKEAAATGEPEDILIDDVPLSELQMGKEYYGSLTSIQQIAHDLKYGTFQGGPSQKPSPAAQPSAKDGVREFDVRTTEILRLRGLLKAAETAETACAQACDNTMAEHHSAQAAAIREKLQATTATGLVDAAKALADRLRMIHTHPDYEAIWFCAQNHIGAYAGPKYDKELSALEAAIGREVSSG